MDLWGAVPSNFYNPTTPKLYFQLDLGRRAASSWALPHISSFVTPLGMTVTDVIFLLISPLDLRPPSDDRRETLPHDTYRGALYNSPKCPIKNYDQNMQNLARFYTNSRVLAPEIFTCHKPGPGPKNFKGEHLKLGSKFHTQNSTRARE